MAQRLNYRDLAPEGLRAMRAVEHYLNTASGLSPVLLELVRLRASLINGCEFCIGLHTHELEKHNEPVTRIDGVAAWRDSDAFTMRERAALAWAEAITDIHPDHAPDEIYEATREHFTDEELVNLTMAIANMNSMNRLAIAFRAERSQPAPKPPAILIGTAR